MQSSGDLGGRGRRTAVQQKGDGPSDDTAKSDLPTGSPEEMADIADRRDHLYQTVGDTRRMHRLADKTIVHYDPLNRLCSVVQNRGRMLATMGYSVSGGGHTLHPEEAVFLLESNSACIRVNDVAISIQQAYRLLLEMNAVSWADYFVYTHLKRAGYIVLPFRSNRDARTATTANTELKRSCAPGAMEASTSEEVTAKRSKESDSAMDCGQKNASDVDAVAHRPFPRSLLDNFPDNRGTSTMRIRAANEWMHLVPPGVQPIPTPATETDFLVDSQSFSAKSSPKGEKSVRPDPPWLSLRPRYWAPLPRGISSRQSWAEFKDEKQRWIARKATARARHESAGFVLQHAPQQSSFIAPSPSAASTFQSPFRIQYDVHLPGSNYSHSYPPTPNHRLIIVDVHRGRLPTPVDLEHLRATAGDQVPIHWAVCDSGQIAFYNADMIRIPTL